jgi:hypothetical protein
MTHHNAITMEGNKLLKNSLLFFGNQMFSNLVIFGLHPKPVKSNPKTHIYSASHSRVAPENVGLQKEQKCNTFAVVCFGNSQKGSWQHDKVR